MANDHLSEGERRLLASFQRDLPAPVRRTRRTGQLPSTRTGFRRTPHMPRLPDPKPGTIAAIINEIEHCGPMLAAERAMLWGNELFTPSEIRAWLENGLRTDDLGLIIDFRAAGVPPEAMTWSARGETMLDRIRIHGYSAHAVVRTLQNTGLLARKSA